MLKRWLGLMPRRNWILGIAESTICAGNCYNTWAGPREARVEMEATTRIMNEQRDKRQKELYDGPAPNPELTQEPQ